MCDAIGANGILRLYEYAINNGGTFFDKEMTPIVHQDAKDYRNARFSTGKICVCHIFDKILRLRSLMLTNSGQKEARIRENLLTHFLYQLFDEEDVPEWSQYLDKFLTSRNWYPIEGDNYPNKTSKGFPSLFWTGGWTNRNKFNGDELKKINITQWHRNITRYISHFVSTLPDLYSHLSKPRSTTYYKCIWLRSLLFFHII